MHLSLVNFILRRLVFLAATLVVVSVLIFLITQVLPGDVAVMILGMDATPDDLVTLRRQLGLERPIPVQYFEWAGGFLRGDLGNSMRFGLPVSQLLLDRIGNSAWLAAAGFAFAIPFGIFLGVLAGLRPGRPLDHSLSITTLFAASMPEFVTGTLLIIVFSTWLGWFPPFSALEDSMGTLDRLHRMVLPVVTLSLVILAYTLRMMRASMIEVMSSAYVHAAILKGLPRHKVVMRHAIPLALGPAVTVSAICVGWMMGGLVIVENMFGYPGVGRLLVFSIQNRDVPVIQAISLLVAAVYALANLIADVICRVLDPRVGHD